MRHTVWWTAFVLMLISGCGKSNSTLTTPTPTPTQAPAPSLTGTWVVSYVDLPYHLGVQTPPHFVVSTDASGHLFIPANSLLFYMNVDYSSVASQLLPGCDEYSYPDFFAPAIADIPIDPTSMAFTTSWSDNTSGASHTAKHTFSGQFTSPTAASGTVQYQTFGDNQITGSGGVPARACPGFSYQTVISWVAQPGTVNSVPFHAAAWRP